MSLLPEASSVIALVMPTIGVTIARDRAHTRPVAIRPAAAPPNSSASMMSHWARSWFSCSEATSTPASSLIFAAVSRKASSWPLDWFLPISMISSIGASVLLRAASCGSLSCVWKTSAAARIWSSDAIKPGCPAAAFLASSIAAIILSRWAKTSL